MIECRVVHVLSSMKIGGAERLVVDLARVQKKSGVDAAIVNFGDNSDDLVRVARAAGLEVVSLASIASRLGRYRTVLRMLRAKQPAALHIHSPWVLRSLAPLLPIFPGAIVYTRHGAHAYQDLSWKLLHHWAHWFVDHLTFVSEEARAVHEKTFGAGRTPHHLLEFGVDTAATSQREGSADAPLRVGNVGRLVSLKGQRDVIDAVARMRPGQAVELHFFGDGPERDALHSHAAALIPGRAVFHGAILDREQIYGSIDILVVASRMEGLSLVIMEAMARQIPVIATAVGGNSRLVMAGKTGMLVAYGDVDALSAALQTLAADRPLRDGLAAAGRQHIAKNYSLDSAAQKLLPLYGFPSLIHHGQLI